MHGDDKQVKEKSGALQCSTGLQAAVVVASESTLLDKFFFPFEDVVM